METHNLASATAITVMLFICGLIISEWLARQWLKRRGRWYTWVPYQRLKLHLSKATFPDFPPITRIWTNRFGARGDHPPRLDENTLRIVVAGGSAAECYFLDQPLTWPEKAAQFLRQASYLKQLGIRRIHVDNIAHSGFMCSDVDRVLEKIHHQLCKLDVIVLMVGASDMIRWMESAGTPGSAAARTSESLFIMHPVISRPWWQLAGLARLIAWLKQYITRPVKTSYEVGNHLDKARKRRQESKNNTIALPDAGDMLTEFELDLRQLISRCQRISPKVVLIQQPHFGRLPTTQEQALMWNFGDGPAMLKPVNHYYAHADVITLMARINGIVDQVGQDMAVAAIVDGQQAITAGSDSFYDFMHLNPHGAEMLGEQVAQAILSSFKTK